MRKLLIPLVSIVFCFQAMSGAESTDTIKIIENVNNLIINQRTNTSTSIIAATNDNHDGFIYEIETMDTTSLDDNKWYMELPFTHKSSQKNRIRTVTSLKNLYGGWIFNYDGKGMIRNMSEWGILEFVGINLKPFKHGPEFDLGLGFGARLYDTQDGWRFNKEDGVLKVISSSGENVKSSRLTSWSFHVPVTITQKIYKNLALRVGGIINFNTYATAKSVYSYDEIQYKEKYKGLHQRFLSIDLYGSIGITDFIGFYCRWSPMSLFKDGNGPEFRTVSLGFTVNY